jgi:hypothetical protein
METSRPFGASVVAAPSVSETQAMWPAKVMSGCRVGVLNEGNRVHTLVLNRPDESNTLSVALSNSGTPGV